MKKLIIKISQLLLVLSITALPLIATAQEDREWYGRPSHWRPYDKRGVNMFETGKQDDSMAFDGLRVRIGAGFTQQFQNLKQKNIGSSNYETSNRLYPISSGFMTAQANLFVDVQLADGIRLNVSTYLSTRHHNEAWVKGGYIQFDKLPFKGQFWKDLMEVTTIKVGHMEINYGDAHFRRSDGGNALYNPFVENNLMDAFTTEIGGELYWQKSGFLAMMGITDGEIQGSVTKRNARKPSFYGKVGYDKTFGERKRVRVTGSIYTTKSSISNTLYGGDRAGSRYYFVMEGPAATLTGNSFSGRINPGFKDNITAFMINPFIKFKGIEVFGTYEIAQGNSQIENGELQSTDPLQPALVKLGKRQFNQYAVDALYRFANEKMYVGAKYNVVDGALAFGQVTTQPNINQGIYDNVTVERTAFAAGWFITRNILMKAEYVTQKYQDFPSTDIRSNGKFQGWVVEGIIGF